MKILKNIKNWILRLIYSETILNYSFKFRNIILQNTICLNNTIFIKKSTEGLIFFVKKHDWKKYIGVEKIIDASNNDYFYSNRIYKANDIDKDYTLCYYSSVPKNLIHETFDELIKHRKDIKNMLKFKTKEEFYK